MELSEKDLLMQQLDEAFQQARYWEKIASQTGKLRLREAENLSAIIQTVKQTESRLKDEITERKSIEEALRMSEKKYRTMMEAMKDAAYIVSQERCIEYVNPRMIKRIGYDATGEICHKTIHGSDDPCSWCVFDQVRQGEDVEYELMSPKDNRYYAITNSPIHHPGGTVSKLSIFRDITESKVIEAQLHQARKMESIGRLAGGIAHDFNNLIFIIAGNAELALKEVPDGNPVYAKLKKIKAAGLRAKEIVKQLLDFSRKSDQKIRPLDLTKVIQDALGFIRSTIPATIEMQANLPETDLTIPADPVQISQVLMNLCTNAYHAMEMTGGVLTIDVEKTSIPEYHLDNYPDLKTGEYAKITISDTGPGIDPDIMDKVFDPYFTTKEAGKGSGLGLAVVHGIVKNHQGAVKVDSLPGIGTRFTALFPMIAADPVPEIEISNEIPHGNETILIVDDEEYIVDVVGGMLEHLGYTVETKTKPVSALDLFQSKPNHFHLVITDMAMPKMNGVKLFEKIMEIRPDIPVIVFTGHSDLMDEQKAKHIGMASYAMKPMILTELAKMVRKVLDEAKGSG